MLTYQQLMEVSFKNIDNIDSTKKLEKTAKQHGINLGKGVQSSHHFDYPNAKDSTTGNPAKTSDNKVIGGSATPKGKITNHTHHEKLKDAIVARHKGKINQGDNPKKSVGYWKDPDKKKERMADAKANKAAKKKQRDPFTREHTEWWLDMWRIDEATESDVRAMGGTDSQIAALKKRQAKRGYGFQSNDKRNTSAPAKTQNNLSKTPNSSALAKREPGGRGVGTTQSSYKTGALAKRPTDKGSALVKGKNFKAANNDEKKTGSRPGSTRDGWGVRPTGDFKDPGNAAHDNVKKMSDYDRARRRRDIENKLDKEDKNKGKTWKDLRAGGKAVGKYVGKKALEVGKGSVTDGPGSSGPDSVQGSSEIIRGRRS